MSDQPAVSTLDLAAYLCSRVCHDVISPVGAIANGLEVLDEEEDAQMREFAMDLIKKSASQASAKLQFARIAFGASGSAGAEIDLADAEQTTRNYLNGSKVALEWQAPRLNVPKNKVKLLMNLVLTAQHAIPRGGNLAVSVEGDPASLSFQLVCNGTGARIPEDAAGFFAGEGDGKTVDAHSVQPYYAALIAREAGLQVTFRQEGDTVTIAAAPTG